MRTAFWHASWKGHEAVCRLLLEKGAAINHQDFEGRTPLHEAAHHGHAHIVKFLIENNAAIDMPDAAGETPLMRAVRGGRIEIVEILLKGGAETNLITPDELTSFHFAAFEGNPELAKYLFYKGSWRNRFSLQERIESQRAEQLIAEQSSYTGEPMKSEGAVAGEGTDAAETFFEAESLETEVTPTPEADQGREDVASGQNRTPRSSASRLSSFGPFDDKVEDGNRENAERSIHSVDSGDYHARETEGEANNGTGYSGTGQGEGETERRPSSREFDDSAELNSHITGDAEG